MNLAVHSIKEYAELNSEEKFWLTQQFLLVDLEACVLETAWCNVDEWQVLGILKDELLIGRSELDTISPEHAPWWPWFSVYYKPRRGGRKEKNEKHGKHLTLISHLLSLLTVFWGSRFLFSTVNFIKNKQVVNISYLLTCLDIYRCYANSRVLYHLLNTEIENARRDFS